MESKGFETEVLINPIDGRSVDYILCIKGKGVKIESHIEDKNWRLHYIWKKQLADKEICTRFEDTKSYTEVKNPYKISISSYDNFTKGARKLLKKKGIDILKVSQFVTSCSQSASTTSGS